MTWKELARLALTLPEVAEGTWFRTPSLEVRGKSFVRLKEDGKNVVFLLESVDEQEFLIEAAPKLFFITDHYRGYPAVLARLSALRPSEAKRRLIVAWRQKAPKKLLKSPPSAPSPSRGVDESRGKRPTVRRGPARAR